jgi:hypothetical protein
MELKSPFYFAQKVVEKIFGNVRMRQEALSKRQEMRQEA